MPWGGVILLLLSCAQKIPVSLPPVERTCNVTLYLNLPDEDAKVLNFEDGEVVEVSKGIVLNDVLIPIVEDNTYTFNGWYYDEEGKNPCNEVSQNTSVYASWLSIWDGHSSDTASITDQYTSDRIVITKASELRGLADLVNGKTKSDASIDPTFEGKMIILANDIDLDNHEWIPIGIGGKSFKGTFSGPSSTDRAVIYNLRITKPYQSNYDYTDVCGLFGVVSGATISNLSIEGEISVSSPENDIRAGAVVGEAKESSVISNCGSSVDIDVTGKFAYAGGIAGAIDEAEISSCFNDGAVESYGLDQCQSGGITAHIFGTSSISNCRNEGSIYAENSPIPSVTDPDQDGTGCMAGGIAGYQEMGSGKNLISSCINTGGVVSKENGHNNSDAGGIVAYVLNLYNANASISIENCINEGNVLSFYNGGEFEHSLYGQYAYAAYGGGITGTLLNYYSSSEIRIEDCVNYGDITGQSNVERPELKSSAIGGVTGILQNIEGSTIITGNHNSGMLTTVMDSGYAVGVVIEASPVTITENTDDTNQWLEDIGYIQRM